MTTASTKPASTGKYSVRCGTTKDVPHLAAIESSAGELFRTVGLDAVAEDEPMPAEVLSSYAEAGNLWVAVSTSTAAGKDSTAEAEERRGNGEGEVVGFLAAFPITITGSPSQQQRSKAEDEGRARERQREERLLLHIAEISVHTSHHRRGLGRMLMQHFENAATTSRSRSTSSPTTSQGKANVMGLSLTTYRDVPFNGPFYVKHGFVEVPPEEIASVVGRRGKELWDEEQAKIAEPGRRCWMVKWLT